MAKVKMPLLSVEARGAVGGLVFNTWRGVNYVKCNTSPTGQGTSKRLAAQALLVAAAQLWKGITGDQRLAWNDYATDHPQTDWSTTAKRLTGQNWFMRCNVQLLRLGLATIADPPALDAPNPITGIVVSYAADYIQLAWTTPATGEFEIDIYSVGPISKGVSPKIQRAQYLRRALPTDFAGVILFPAATAGRYTIFARVLCRNTGLTSTWLSGYADAT